MVTVARERLAIQPVGGDAWLIQNPGRPGNRLSVTAADRRAARKVMRRHQLSLVRYLATEHIAWMLRELQITCVLDVGANIGQYGQALRSAGYTGRIVSFEPLPHLADQLLRASADDPDWHVMRCALGEAEHEAEMSVTPGRGTTSSLLPASDFGKAWSPSLEGTHRQNVLVRRLDGLFDEVVEGLDSPRVYLKLDTQGYDLQAFRGAGNRMADIVGLQSEVSSVPIYDGMPRLIEQIPVYEAAGFEITGMFPVSIDRKSLRVIEFDTVMIRVEALER